MTGPDYDDDEFEEVRPVPHPDDRLWRHPSEIAAMHTAHATAETTKVPVVQVAQESRSRLHVGLMVAAGVAVVGAAALTIGVVSSPGASPRVQPNAAASAIDVAAGSGSPVEPFASLPERSNSSIAAGASDEGEELLAARVHNAVAMSLPRIQAATAGGTREGSGLFVTDDGHIATSAALISNAESILVWTEDGQRWKAQLLAADPISDVAVLQIDSNDWPSVPLGSGVGLRTGQYALAIDHEQHEIMLGEITGVDADGIGVHHPTVLPGSAILDDTGDVIAMVISDGTNAQATPIWVLEQVTVDLITLGSTTHTWLGVLVESDSDETGTIVVGDVSVDSPADQAGLRTGDVIDSVNGMPTADAMTLQRQVQSLNPGDEAVLTVTRNGSRRIIIAMLTEHPG